MNFITHNVSSRFYMFFKERCFLNHCYLDFLKNKKKMLNLRVTPVLEKELIFICYFSPQQQAQTVPFEYGNKNIQQTMKIENFLYFPIALAFY